MNKIIEPLSLGIRNVFLSVDNRNNHIISTIYWFFLDQRKSTIAHLNYIFVTLAQPKSLSCPENVFLIHRAPLSC